MTSLRTVLLGVLLVAVVWSPYLLVLELAGPRQALCMMLVGVLCLG